MTETNKNILLKDSIDISYITLYIKLKISFMKFASKCIDKNNILFDNICKSIINHKAERYRKLFKKEIRKIEKLNTDKYIEEFIRPPKVFEKSNKQNINFNEYETKYHVMLEKKLEIIYEEAVYMYNTLKTIENNFEKTL